ncbi:MAG: hypothetical protein E8D45_08870 [Nitrospira sp.]|nr:MAG: hypothetical protein E8D45_08870 [Nitrospira sp.]
MTQRAWSRTGFVAGVTLAGWCLLWTGTRAAAVELPTTIVVAESTVSRPNTLLEDVIGAVPAPPDRHQDRPSAPGSPDQHYPLSSPIVVGTDIRPSRVSSPLMGDLAVREMISGNYLLGLSTRFVQLVEGEKTYEVNLAVPTPFLFDPARGILVFDVMSLSQAELSAVYATLLTPDDSIDRPLPPVDAPGPVLNGPPDRVGAVLHFAKRLMNNPELGFFAVLGSGLAGLALVQRFRSGRQEPEKRQDSRPASTATSDASYRPKDFNASAAQEGRGEIAPERMENVPARRSAA